MNDEKIQEEHYIKIYPKELCNFFKIKYHWYDKININFISGFKASIRLIFKYKEIILHEKSINRFLKKNNYNRFRMTTYSDNSGTDSYIYGTRFKLR